VSTWPALACAPRVIVSVSKLFVVADDAAVLVIPVHVTAPAAFHRPSESVIVIVPAIGIAADGVTTNVTADGVSS